MLMNNCEKPWIMQLTDFESFLKVNMVIDAGHQYDF